MEDIMERTINNSDTKEFIDEIMGSMDYSLAGFDSKYEMVTFILSKSRTYSKSISEITYNKFLDKLLDEKINSRVIDIILDYVECNLELML